jgi:GntR family transcriptional regulator, transcriptional repressor for pyruvate dehydrogenase complex
VRALHSSTYPASCLDVTPEVARKTVKQHIAIAAAIEAGNADGAASGVRPEVLHELLVVAG